MSTKKLFSIIDVICDNLMNSVTSADDQERCISEFRDWISLSWLGGLIETEDYELVRRYGESSIEEHFKEFNRWY